MAISSNKKTISLATGAALTASLALSPTLVNAQSNPFTATELSSGYMQLAEGNCGGNMKKKAEHEAKCGAKMKEKAEKMKEGKCGAKQ